MTNLKNKKSKWYPYLNDSQFQKWDNLPDWIKSFLKQEYKYTAVIEGFQYRVKVINGKWFVFRRNLDVTSETPKETHVHSRGHPLYKVLTSSERIQW